MDLKQLITYLKQNKKIAVFSAVVVVLLVYSAIRFCDDDKDASLMQKVPAAVRSSTSNAKKVPTPDKAGERMEIEIEGVKVAFRWCPPGKFTRHCDKPTQYDWEAMWDDDKGDFTITLTKGFWLAETETTQELWVAVTGENPSKGVRKKLFPVNYDSWIGTQEFISKLNESGFAPDGFEFRLPTEAQWEYACMAGTTDECYGELDAIAWYRDNSDSQSHEVGTKEANAWGLYDMIGNVWEMCEDWYVRYPLENLTDYTGPQDGWEHVLRGGDWNTFAGNCSRSSRSRWDLRKTYIEIYYRGFRLALVPKE